MSFSSFAKCPQPKVMEQLYSWIKLDDEDLNYFSGTATYSQTFHIEKDGFSSSGRLYLDLGRVEVMARVKINGQDLGILWKPLYRIDITDQIQSSSNHLGVDVTNL